MFSSVHSLFSAARRYSFALSSVLRHALYQEEQKMKNETVEIEKSEGKVGLTAATLPWWVRLLIAQRVEIVFPKGDSHFTNYCADCGCVLIPTNTAYQDFFDHCLECSENNRSSQGGN